MPGLFITFEGGEGAGKTTLITKIAQTLAAGTERSIVCTREPGGSFVGQALREVLLHAPQPLDARAEALLFAADRAQHVAEVIRPALELGAIVLCDRYTDSSAAYQGVSRGLGEAEVRSLSAWGTRELMPTRTYLLDIDPKVGLARKSLQPAEETNRMEAEDLAFHGAVREAFLSIAQANPARIRVLDATAPIGKLAAQCAREIFDLL